MNNIVNAVFDFGCTSAIAERRYQWDYGQVLRFTGLQLPEHYEVHFANAPEGPSKTAIGDASGVAIPDEYLTTGQPVCAWVFLHAGDMDGETRYAVTIPVLRRAKPSDDPPTPQQQSALSQAIAALNDGVARAEAASSGAEAAEDSAVLAAELAESWAIGGTGLRPDEIFENARHYAEVARQGAEASGYAFFDIDDRTGRLRVTVADNLADETRFAINENTGILEVHVE